MLLFLGRYKNVSKSIAFLVCVPHYKNIGLPDWLREHPPPARVHAQGEITKRLPDILSKRAFGLFSCIKTYLMGILVSYLQGLWRLLH